HPAVDQLHHVLDLQEIRFELLLQRRIRELADGATGRSAPVVVVDTHTIRAPAHVDLDVVDAERDGAAVALGCRQARNAAFAAVRIEQSWHGGFGTPGWIIED